MISDDSFILQLWVRAQYADLTVSLSEHFSLLSLVWLSLARLGLAQNVDSFWEQCENRGNVGADRFTIHCSLH